MKNQKRAVRRQHNKRLMKKRLREELDRIYYGNGDYEEREVDCVFRARIRLNTSCNCSCAMCGNPRRSIWYSGEQQKTMQERKSNEYFLTWHEETLDTSAGLV